MALTQLQEIWQMPSGVRRATRADVLALIGLARRNYNADSSVDPGAVSAWLSANLDRPEFFGCIANGAATISMACEWFTPGIPEVTVLYLLGRGHIWSAVRCLRATAIWALHKGAKVMKVDAETEIEIAPLLKRVGFPFHRIEAFTVELRG